MSASVTRIISDVHYGDPASWVQRVSQLAPLLHGVDRVIVNGDALDTQIIDDAHDRISELNQLISSHVPEHLFITGNHDPDISQIHEMLLANDRVWVTHGDVYFDDIAPWSRLVGELRRRITHHAAGLSATELQLIETRFRVFRKACLKLPREHDPRARGQWPRMMRIAKAIFPPHRFLTMLRVWREMPGIAAGLAREQRQSARLIVAGHTHKHGVWRQADNLVVVNTGCFCAGRGALLVDVREEKAQVRNIERRSGEFRAGSTVAEFTLAPEQVSALTGST